MSTPTLVRTPAELEGHSWLRRIDRALAELRQPMDVLASRLEPDGDGTRSVLIVEDD